MQQSTVSKYRILRTSCWLVALILGALQAWATRFTMNPDGVSYLDIGDAYWHGDWHNAINAYWSPLYSWILGFFLKVLKPSAYWEYPVAHLVNFITYIFALACFEFFLFRFVRDLRNKPRSEAETPIPDYAWWLLGYGFFISTSLLMIGLALVTPDMCVAGFVYLASALVLQIRNGSGWRIYALLGAVLGFAYLAKAIMLPVGVLFLGAALYKNGRSLRNAAIAAAFFLGIGGPFVIALSFAQRHLTFGEVGPVAYEVFVNGVDQFIPTQDELRHPIRKFSETPLAYEFGKPIAGTYPLWYDPTYWHAGLKPRFELVGEWHAVRLAFLLLFWVLSTFQLNFLVPFLALLLIAPQPRSCWRRMVGYWPLIIPAITAIVLYSLVYAETRYLGPFFLLLWVVGFSGLHFHDSRSMRTFLGCASAAIAVTTLIFVSYVVSREFLAGRVMGPVYSQAATALKELGVQPGDRFAVFAREPFGEGGAFVARLNRARIVVQSRDVTTDWMTDAGAIEKLIAMLDSHNVKAILFYGEPPSNSRVTWQRLDQTPYRVFVLQR